MTQKNDHNSANSDSIANLDCREVVARLGDFVDRELSSSEHNAMEAHLDRCPACAAFAASYQHVVESAALLREPEEKPLPVAVQNRLRKALNERLGIRLPYIA
jgi:anti-sigma factor RsiW